MVQYTLKTVVGEEQLAKHVVDIFLGIIDFPVVELKKKCMIHFN